MRKTTNLVLAAAMAATAFASTAAAQRGAAECENPDEREVVTEKGWEGELGVGPVPLGAPVFYVHTLKFDPKRGGDHDVTITISWADGFDYDLEAWFVDGEEASERQTSLGDQMMAGDEATETVLLEDVPACADLKVGIQNFIGNPAASVNAVIEVD